MHRRVGPVLITTGVALLIVTMISGFGVILSWDGPRNLCRSMSISASEGQVPEASQQGENLRFGVTAVPFGIRCSYAVHTGEMTAYRDFGTIPAVGGLSIAVLGAVTLLRPQRRKSRPAQL